MECVNASEKTRLLSHNNKIPDVRAKRTLGACEVAVLLTLGDGTVDVALEGSVAKVGDLVVGLDVLLDCLAAVEVWSA